MTTYSFGDVVLVPFPFTDQTASKKRPAVVVSSDEYHRERFDLILIAVTSQFNPGNVFGELTITHWQAAGLLKPSIIKPVLTTIETSMVFRKLGQLQDLDRQNLQHLLQIILGVST
ncbi:growth inhibitor [Nostoc sp. PCC 7524]|uniref:type II toxin-antitoxin system PemK/MazF family toxin n=1 Tax=Nostoc sp. (strain ATCC 29411 / PCC 7524) TaxID=28072 RepID=UPI00029EF068|nr:type II toxin-antitoxin system PemK/MazF family toxin [Nostoc sp. PCC 7524]AFY49159.1 growth inhibitor [Nostoc sp. PCC 7524]